MDEQSPEQRRRALHLIRGGRSREIGAAASSAVDTSKADSIARELRAEAVAIEAWYGANAYSRYLTKHGRRPDPVDAATIGRIIGAQVKASDGTMQPRLSKAERQRRRRTTTRRNALQNEAEIECSTQVLTAATTALSEVSRHSNKTDSYLDES